jgi:phenylacetate-CoA ligase
VFRDVFASSPASSPQAAGRAYRRELRTRPESYWNAKGERRALALFQAAAARVPAYRDFLRSQGIHPAAITSTADFVLVPPTDKVNYVAAYPLAERSWDGSLQEYKLVAVSSGTSGAPALWPRGVAHEAEAAIVHDVLFTGLFGIEKRRTLIVVAFPMGMYVSGVATALPTLATAAHHRNCTVVTPGNNREAILSAVRALARDFEQTVLVGHPLFLKDVLEEGARTGIDWSSLQIRMLHCSEGFNEQWRNYVHELLGQRRESTIYNSYGSSEFLLMAYETPETVAIRRTAESDARVRDALFGGSVPNLFQYNPALRYFETAGENLLVTADVGTPLIRFNQHDAGRIVPRAALVAAGIRTVPAAHASWTPWRLPFVTLTERSDRTLVFFAANIYPEHVQQALNQAGFFGMLTGRFVMELRQSKSMDPLLHIIIEMQPGASLRPALAKRIETILRETLLNINLEYRDAVSKLTGKDLSPHVELRLYRDVEYFKEGVKPRYIALPS